MINTGSRFRIRESGGSEEPARRIFLRCLAVRIGSNALMKDIADAVIAAGAGPAVGGAVCAAFARITSVISATDSAVRGAIRTRLWCGALLVPAIRKTVALAAVAAALARRTGTLTRTG